MEGRAGQIGGAKASKAKGGATVIKTYGFTCPSTGAILHTTKPDLLEVAAVVNATMAGIPPVAELSKAQEELIERTIQSKMLGYFASYCVKLTKEQFIEGGRAVMVEYKKAGYTKKPGAKELIQAIVLLVYCRTDNDRLVFLAHMTYLSGLIDYMKKEGQKATQKVLEG